MSHPLFLVAAAADLTAVFVHGVGGYRAMIAPLIPERLFATATFGDADMSGRIYTVGWHLVTAVFFCSAVAMALAGFGVVRDPAMTRFIGALHLSFVLLPLPLVAGRMPAAIRRPVPIAFFTCLGTVAAVGLLG